MKPFLTILMATLIAGTAGATTDPDPNQIGIYFDEGATAVCLDVLPTMPFTAYLAITNPTADPTGIVFSLCYEAIPAAPAVLLGTTTAWVFLPTVFVDWCSDGWNVDFTDPVPPVDGASVIAALQMMLLSPAEVHFYLGPGPDVVERTLPWARFADGTYLPLGVSSGDPALPVAMVNACNVVTVEPHSFGQVKSLYR